MSSDLPQYPSYPGAEGDQPPSWPASDPGQDAPDAARGYAGWWSRVGAAVIDALLAFAIGFVLLVAGGVLAFRNAETDPVTGEVVGGVDPVGVALMILSVVVYLGVDIWNRVVRVGSTGQSLGKKAVGIRIVSAEHSTAIGGGAAFGRWAITLAFGLVPLLVLSLLDVLWPVWDDRSQALHDKVVGSVVVRA